MYSRNNTKETYIKKKTRKLKELAELHKDELPEHIYKRLLEFDFKKAIETRNVFE